MAQAAVSALVKRALHELADRDGAPVFGAMPDYRGWRRTGQELFLALRPKAWNIPKWVTTVGWLDTFPEMKVVRQVISTDPVMDGHVDTLVGMEFHQQHCQLGWLLIEQLLQPMVVDIGSYWFDDAVFESYYRNVEDGLLAEHVRVVEFVPLLAFTAVSFLKTVEFSDGLVLRPMTDAQISAAIGHHAVPAEFAGSTNSLQLSRFHQWALSVERSYPVCSNKLGVPDQPVAPPFPSLQDEATRLVAALRIVCGGSAITTRPIWGQHDDDFPLITGTSALLSTVDAADFTRPTLLLTHEDVDAVREVYALLGTPAVRNDRGLQTALRRLIRAGSSSDTADRLVDLMICAEVLFLKRINYTGFGKGIAIADQAKARLAGDTVLNVVPSRISEFMIEAYRLRNAEMHGDDPNTGDLRLLDGSSSNTLGPVVEDIERVMRRALRLVVTDVAPNTSDAP